MKKKASNAFENGNIQMTKKLVEQMAKKKFS
jgi:hypothetical protein